MLITQFGSDMVCGRVVVYVYVCPTVLTMYIISLPSDVSVNIYLGYINIRKTGF